MKSLAFLPIVMLFACKSAPEPAATPSTPIAPVAPATSAAAPAERTDRGWATRAGGCGDFSVQVTHASKRQFMLIGSSRKALGLTKVGDSKTISLAGGDHGLSFEISVYAAPGGDGHCTDVVPSQRIPQTASLSAVAGTVTVTLSSFTSETNFAIDITLTGVRVPNHGTLEAVPDATYADVHVGWTAG